jgi:tetratricopeptide (TPR) repeat protein
MGRFDHEHYANEALAIWEKQGELHWQAMVLNHLGIRAYFLGQWDRALEMYDRSKVALERIGDQWNAAIAVGNVAEIYVDQGRLDDADALTRRAMRVFRAAGTPNYIAGANALLGRVAARNGAFDEAHELMQMAKDEYLQDGDLPEAIEVDGRVAECFALQGRAEEALALVECTLDAVQSADGVAAVVPLLERVRAYAYAQQGDWALALGSLEASLLTARRRNARHDVALTLDAMVRIDAWEGMPPDPVVAAERDQLFAQLGIVSAPVVPLPGEALRIPEPRDTALSPSVEPA